jgi:hypothetical protein
MIMQPHVESNRDTRGYIGDTSIFSNSLKTGGEVMLKLLIGLNSKFYVESQGAD